MEFGLGGARLPPPRQRRPRVVAMLGSGKIDVTPLNTNTYDFAESIEAFDFARSAPPATVKVQIQMP